MSRIWSRSEIDQLGQRLRRAATTDDLRLLDEYRRGFRDDYESLVAGIRSQARLEPSGRPAKSTLAILEKLRRSSARLSQIQDIAGCRLVLPDVPSQDQLVATLAQMFPAKVVDRRVQPSFGYRAVHLVVRPGDWPIEIQVRTQHQHLWAELSEKMADALGQEVKYGGGPSLARATLDRLSAVIVSLEKLEADTRAMPEMREEIAMLREKFTVELEAMIEEVPSRANT